MNTCFFPLFPCPVTRYIDTAAPNKDALVHRVRLGHCLVVEEESTLIKHAWSVKAEQPQPSCSKAKACFRLHDPGFPETQVPGCGWLWLGIQMLGTLDPECQRCVPGGLRHPPVALQAALSHISREGLSRECGRIDYQSVLHCMNYFHRGIRKSPMDRTSHQGLLPDGWSREFVYPMDQEWHLRSNDMYSSSSVSLMYKTLGTACWIAFQLGALR